MNCEHRVLASLTLLWTLCHRSNRPSNNSVSGPGRREDGEVWGKAAGLQTDSALKKATLEMEEGAWWGQFRRNVDPKLELLDPHSKKRLCYLLSRDG